MCVNINSLFVIVKIKETWGNRNVSNMIQVLWLLMWGVLWRSFSHFMCLFLVTVRARGVRRPRRLQPALSLRWWANSWRSSWTRRMPSSRRSLSKSSRWSFWGLKVSVLLTSNVPVVSKSRALKGSQVVTRLSLSPAAELLPDEAPDTTSDLMLAQMLQMQFDREFDDQLRREEKKFNGDSKGDSESFGLCEAVEVLKAPRSACLWTAVNKV